MFNCFQLHLLEEFYQNGYKVFFHSYSLFIFKTVTLSECSDQRIYSWFPKEILHLSFIRICLISQMTQFKRCFAVKMHFRVSILIQPAQINCVNNTQFWYKRLFQQNYFQISFNCHRMYPSTGLSSD